jgi:hypothetical protein
VRQQLHALFTCAIILGGILKEASPKRELAEIRILVAFEDEYRTYRDVIAAAIRVSRPHIEVATAGVGGLAEEISRFDPQVVICSRPNTSDPSGEIAWVEISLDRVEPAKVYIAGRYSERSSLPALEMLLAVVDEAEGTVRPKLRPQM